MVEYFYTLELGDVYGPKLERLAADAGFDDFEAFAAMILRTGLDEMDRHHQRQGDSPSAETKG